MTIPKTNKLADYAIYAMADLSEADMKFIKSALQAPALRAYLAKLYFDHMQVRATQQVIPGREMEFVQVEAYNQGAMITLENLIERGNV